MLSSHFFSCRGIFYMIAERKGIYSYIEVNILKFWHSCFYGPWSTSWVIGHWNPQDTTMHLILFFNSDQWKQRTILHSQKCWSPNGKPLNLHLLCQNVSAVKARRIQYILLEDNLAQRKTEFRDLSSHPSSSISSQYAFR